MHAFDAPVSEDPLRDDLGAVPQTPISLLPICSGHGHPSVRPNVRNFHLCAPAGHDCTHMPGPRHATILGQCAGGCAPQSTISIAMVAP